MYYCDTYAGKVYAMPCAADGTPDTSAPWRTIVTLDSDTQGAPDGMAIDTEHRLWVAHESGGQVIRSHQALRSHAAFRHCMQVMISCRLHDMPKLCVHSTTSCAPHSHTHTTRWAATTQQLVSCCTKSKCRWNGQAPWLLAAPTSGLCHSPEILHHKCAMAVLVAE
jgi:sugar lactone lactonase YvrE